MDVLPIGPYKTVTLPNGTLVPWYIIPFDSEGECTGPQTRNRLLQELKGKQFSDVYVFSHGWNNAWKEATQRYESFVEGFLSMRDKFNLKTPPGYQPLLIGVYWPSTAMVTEKEIGPRILADGPQTVTDDDGVAEERLRITELAAVVPRGQRERFYELTQLPEIGETQAKELASMLKAIYESPDEDLPAAEGMSETEILAGWKQTQVAPPPDKMTAGAIDDSDEEEESNSGEQSPQAAGKVRDLAIKLLPRDIIRAATVYQMKDRAGQIGSTGGKKLIEDAFDYFSGKLHLIGHSYGCKLLLSALKYAKLPRNRKAHSILLLQPAVSHLCFAEKVADTDKPGGYRDVLDRVEKPIFSTYSRNDVPLHKLFHLGVRRDADLAEVRTAANSKKPPSRYAALGGYGPRRSGEKLIDLEPWPTDYKLTENIRIYGLDGTDKITGHGDVTQPHTWWALYQQIKVD